MQATAPTSPVRPIRATLRGIAWFLLFPLITALAAAGYAMWQIDNYEAAHSDRIFTGVTVGTHDLSKLTEAEATALLAAAVPLDDPLVTLADPNSGRSWTATAREMGVSYDVSQTVAEALQVGRQGDQQAQLRAQFQTWHQGHPVTPPTLMIDQNRQEQLLADISAELTTFSADPALLLDNGVASVQTGQVGQVVDIDAAREQLQTAVTNLTPTIITLTTTQIVPREIDAESASVAIERLTTEPISFYLEEPIDGADLDDRVLSAATLTSWLRVDPQADDDLLTYNVYLDENGARAWLNELAPAIEREPVRARFYFDDPTAELVLVEPHVNGRRLNVEATLERLMSAANSAERDVPLVVETIVPTVHSGATGAELGITELISPTAKTFFFGSDPERMDNIALAASRFYGIVIEPGEEFSFNKYLGEISVEQGFKPALIIIGGRTVEGAGGGVCQVSTTLFQAAFWGGFEIGDRWQHAYRVPYYEDGTAPDNEPLIGLDATIYSPEIDFTFTNNTPHHILIENYYREGEMSLEFKIYSTSLGRRVEREVSIWNETEPPPDIYEFDAAYEGTDFEQIDWAVPGANVSVHRIVYNQWGDQRDENYFNSTYIPWRNIYRYGPNTDQSLIPEGAIRR